MEYVFYSQKKRNNPLHICSHEVTLSARWFKYTLVLEVGGREVKWDAPLRNLARENEDISFDSLTLGNIVVGCGGSRFGQNIWILVLMWWIWGMAFEMVIDNIKQSPTKEKWMWGPYLF